jgi:predicted  nucleic acid-binding Zn-ribbon protein
MSARPEVFAAHDIELLSIADVLTPREPFAFDRFDRESFVWTRGPSRLATSHRAAMREIARLRAEVSRLRSERDELRDNVYVLRAACGEAAACILDKATDVHEASDELVSRLDALNRGEFDDAARVAAPRQPEEPRQ